jgi:hypothetical protein
MTDEPLFRNHPRRALHQKLRELFKELGGNVPMRTLADEAVERGIIPPEELDRCRMLGVIALCRQALKAKGENGLPFAKPTIQDTESPSDTWKQLELFTYAEAEALLAREANGITGDIEEWMNLHRWCYAKFGRAPKIPQEWRDLVLARQ